MTIGNGAVHLPAILQSRVFRAFCIVSALASLSLTTVAILMLIGFGSARLEWAEENLEIALGGSGALFFVVYWMYSRLLNNYIKLLTTTTLLIFVLSISILYNSALLREIDEISSTEHAKAHFIEFGSRRVITELQIRGVIDAEYVRHIAYSQSTARELVSIGVYNTATSVLMQVLTAAEQEFGMNHPALIPASD